MSNVLLSLDVSTKTIGIGVFRYSDFDDKELIHYEFYRPNQTKKSLSSLTDTEVLLILLETRKYILSIAKQYNITEFVIEDYVRFMKNQSAAGTVIPLSILNMTLRIAIYDSLSIEPVALNVLKIRHTLKLNKKFPSKEDIPNLVAYYLDLDEFPWYTKINRRTKEEQIMEESYDVADGIAVGLAYIKIKSSGKALVSLKKNKKRKRKNATSNIK